MLTAPRVRLRLREAILRARRTRPFRIDAWAPLPHNLHCTWTSPPEDGDFFHDGVIKRCVSQQGKDTCLDSKSVWVRVEPMRLTTVS